MNLSRIRESATVAYGRMEDGHDSAYLAVGSRVGIFDKRSSSSAPNACPPTAMTLATSES